MQKKPYTKHISNLPFYQLAEEKKLIMEKTREKKPTKTGKKHGLNINNSENNRSSLLYWKPSNLNQHQIYPLKNPTS